MAFTTPVSLVSGPAASRFTRGSVCVRRNGTAQGVKSGTRITTPAFPVVASATAGTNVKEVTAEELESFVQACARPIVLDAYAEWCGPCQMLKPELEKLAGRYKDAVDILKFDTEANDAHMDMASAMMVRGLPTLFFIKDGQLLYRMEGALPAESLEIIVDHLFFDGPKPEGL